MVNLVSYIPRPDPVPGHPFTKNFHQFFFQHGHRVGFLDESGQTFASEVLGSILLVIATAEYTITAVPVPATAWVFGSALGLFGWMGIKPT
ncbi:MAG: hypothetical protein QGH93_13125 [Gammaproteobacteria bacterium]|jgi:hypothetical protein|nr:hypothetical protein [Gammaproteobacteria bacterium]